MGGTIKPGDKINCCDSEGDCPPGVTMTRLLEVRHAWSDVIQCPDCGAFWMMRKLEATDDTAKQ